MRQRSFDIGQAIDGALDIIWLNGYEATSVDELCQCMGISRSSLYQAFGSKPALLETVIDRYAEQAVARLERNFVVPRTFRENMRAVLEDFAAGAISGETRRGCFVGELIAEFPACSYEQTRLLEKKVRLLKRAIRDAVQTVIDSGEIKSTHNPDQLTHFLFATIQGLRLTGKITPEKEILQSIIDTALNCVE